MAEKNMKETLQKNQLNQSLKVFFSNALKVAIRNPLQVFSFMKTLFWLGRAAKLRSKWGKEGVHVPPIIIFSITNQCNLACKGCYAQQFHDSAQEELSPDQLYDITTEAKELGVSFFVIAGGEPFMRSELLTITRDFPEIIFLIFTNGLMIDDDMIATFKKQKNTIPLVSLEGDENDTDGRRGTGTYDLTVQTMQKMKKQGIFFGTSLTITRQNFATLMNDSFTQNLVKLGCKFFLYIEYTPIAEGTDEWVLPVSQREQVMRYMESFRSKYSALFIAVPWDENDVGGCLSAGRGFVHINAAGDLEPCPFAPFSDVNLKTNSLRKALDSQLLKEIRKRPELARETGGGCVLWKERKLVQSLLAENNMAP